MEQKPDKREKTIMWISRERTFQEKEIVYAETLRQD